MPYRKLPKTDQTRIKSLQKAIELDKLDLNDIPVPLKLITEAKNILPFFSGAVKQYNMTFENRVNDNKKYQHIMKNARMYISHFIQVLNLAVIRNEIKKDNKEYYGLDIKSNAVPDLTSESDIAEWGKKIIEGEHLRIHNGGIPLQNPTIAKVQVHYDIFKDYKFNQNNRKKATTRDLQAIAEMRQTVDTLIKDIWDETEQFYAQLPPYKRLQACKKCGIIYYYRKGEDVLTPDADKKVEDNRNINPELLFN